MTEADLQTLRREWEEGTILVGIDRGQAIRLLLQGEVTFRRNLGRAAHTERVTVIGLWFGSIVALFCCLAAALWSFGFWGLLAAAVVIPVFLLHWSVSIHPKTRVEPILVCLLTAGIVWLRFGFSIDSFSGIEYLKILALAALFACLMGVLLGRGGAAWFGWEPLVMMVFAAGIALLHVELRPSTAWFVALNALALSAIRLAHVAARDFVLAIMFRDIEGFHWLCPMAEFVRPTELEEWRKA